jgi:protein-S-isoprenylcysteine O-methyltransferase Ste14
MNPTTPSSPAQRVTVLIYGIVSYIIGVTGLVCLIAAFGKLVPFGFLSGPDSGSPIVTNLFLVAAWGFFHSVMARDGFKAQITRFIPEPAERPTYVLVSGVTSILLVGWAPTVPGTVWSVGNPLAVTVLWALFAFGWSYLLAATFAINHFDLFGLRQVYLNFRSQPRPPLHFVKRAMYRFSRHPIQAGVLIGIWSTPEMTATHFTLSVGFTAYIFIGLWFEEKDLVRDIGEPYLQYRREAGMLGPKLFRRG